MKKKNVIVCGAGGFIGSHLASQLKRLGYYVIGVDIKYPIMPVNDVADVFQLVDLRRTDEVNWLFQSYHPEQVFQLAADMGGAGYLFTGENDANVMTNSAMINLNVANACMLYRVDKAFYSSSACIYPQSIQTESEHPGLKEGDAYPADPDSEYGWEKLFSERLWMAYANNYGMKVRIARFHNIFGPHGSWNDGKEKVPAAMCRKVAEYNKGKSKEIEIWGDGEQQEASYI